uniref:UspA domain-containing protein n=1 Tax=Arcella intermedia TaxID=1963864 RepID=A0A6B2LHW2_9EUKA|eukprot:TRINITY_DN5571_c0_g1_i1.p1 TRINITY_DN5571_c0_g1~~TRINITY_DN5571_c0_g1_i1.p1  ORF type:complete len:223 (+),score=42.19 TRINITY_DN5571_c0_g1_i1:29-697(+)
MSHWMVAVDDSEYSGYAFNYCVHMMDKKNDHLYILNVYDEPTTTYGGYSVPELVQKLVEVEEKRSKKILAHYGGKAKALEVSHTMIKGCSHHPGDMICKGITNYQIDTLVLGRRDMGDLKRFFVGSTSKYVIENAECNVVVVKLPFGEAEDAAIKKKAIQGEEIDRMKRIFGKAMLTEKQKRKALAVVEPATVVEEVPEGDPLLHLFHTFVFHDDPKQNLDE